MNIIFLIWNCSNDLFPINCFDGNITENQKLVIGNWIYLIVEHVCSFKYMNALKGRSEKVHLKEAKYSLCKRKENIRAASWFCSEIQWSCPTKLVNKQSMHFI